MKRLLAIVLSTICLFVRLNMAQEAAILEDVRRVTELPVTDFHYFETAPAREAWFAYGDIYGGYGHKQPNVVRKASVAIANNTAVAPYVEKKLKAMPHLIGNDGARLQYFKFLGSIPAPWAARLLGTYLFDERPMTGVPSIDVDAAPNPSYAARGLAQMGFSDAPSKAGVLEPLTPEDIEEWKMWWRANESRIDERIREINPDYNPKPLTAESPSSFPIAPW